MNRRLSTPSNKEGTKLSTSAFTLMSNYPPSSSMAYIEECSQRDSSWDDAESQMQKVSKNINGKQMIKLNPDILYLPAGSWKEYPNRHCCDQYIYVSTTFSPTSMNITSTSGADYFSLQCIGVTEVKALFHDKVNQNDTQPQSINHPFMKRDVRTHIENIDVPKNYKVVGDPYHETFQEISFRSPWPCCHLEVSFVGQSGLFVSILQVAIYGESLPSGLSTPIKKLP